ncbi:MAG: rhodanese-like domain-containing protein [Bacteroidales bacterium]|nr:rhodanese-like domain-containing protein [Bacteroidales bacterium]MCF8333145.1 rhodanese-like domain-containing protein [Bacteroidales bacterium]
MNTRYIILAILLLALGAGTMILPDKAEKEELPAERLLLDITSDTRFKEPIFVAQKIIEKDPVYTLIDVRTSDQYNEFHLPGTINIPLKEFNNPEYQGYLDREVKNNIFISNGSLKADQAWFLCRRKGYENNYVMQGGLNQWVENILRPTPPPATASKAAFEEYNRCKAASLYFGGGSMDISTEVRKEELPVKRKKKERKVAGGC